MDIFGTDESYKGKRSVQFQLSIKVHNDNTLVWRFSEFKES